MSRKRSKRKPLKNGPHVDRYAKFAPDISPWMKGRMKGDEDTPAVEPPAPPREVRRSWDFGLGY